MTLPDGLKIHCASCGLVVPCDAPSGTGPDCIQIARNKLAWFNPAESLAGQFAMAAGAWSMIHWTHLRSAAPDPAVVAYNLHVHTNRKAAYAASAARQAMTPAQVTAEAAHRSYAWLHEVS